MGTAAPLPHTFDALAGLLSLTARPFHFDRLTAEGRVHWLNRSTPGQFRQRVLRGPQGIRVPLDWQHTRCVVLDLKNSFDWGEYVDLASAEPKVVRFKGQSMVAIACGLSCLLPLVAVCWPSPSESDTLVLPDQTASLVVHGAMTVRPVGKCLRRLVLVPDDCELETATVLDYLEALATSLPAANIVVVAEGEARESVDKALLVLTVRRRSGRRQAYIDLRSRQAHYDIIGERNWDVEMELGDGSDGESEGRVADESRVDEESSVDD